MNDMSLNIPRTCVVKTMEQVVEKQKDCFADAGMVALETGLRVLVTGATGFLGGRLVRLLENGLSDTSLLPFPAEAKSIVTITATGRNVEKGRHLLESLGKQSKTCFVKTDLSDAKSCFELVKDHNVVYHCAALCSLWKRWEKFISANIHVAENIAEACCLCRVKLLVHISSPSICNGFDSGDRWNVRECEPLASDDNQQTRYTATKKWAEDIVTEVANRKGLPCIILRPRAIFGPGDEIFWPSWQIAC